MFNYKVQDTEKGTEVVDCACGKSKVKSGKYAKSNTNLVRQEVWPHTAISKKYMRRSTFDNLDFEGFVAGETKIIYSMLMNSDQNGIGRLRVLMLISHWYGKTRQWNLVRSLFESIMEEIELGEKDWVDDFTGYETMLPSMVTHTGVSGSMQESHKVVRKSQEVYWCKQFQTGQCELESPHMQQIKPEEPAVPVLHICAYCWTTFKKRKEHMESDCGAKK